jgi:hypothetical protein
MSAFLGDGALTLTDVFGNVSEVAREGATRGRRREARVELTESPVVIEGIDLELVRLLSAVRVEPTQLESDNQDREGAVVIENPWSVGMTGQVTVLEPGGFEAGQRDRSWRISPRTQRFSAEAGELARVPLTIGLSPSVETGPREFVLRLDVAGERSYEGVEVRRWVNVGSTTLRLALSARQAGAGVVVEASVGNGSAEALRGISITAFAPGQPRAKGVIAEVPVGREVVRSFTFADAAGLRGQRVTVRVTDTQTGATVTRSVVVP